MDRGQIDVGPVRSVPLLAIAGLILVVAYAEGGLAGLGTTAITAALVVVASRVVSVPQSFGGGDD